MTNTHRQQQIESILNDDLSIRYGETAWREQVDAITAMAESVGTTFGPYGHDKLIVDNGGNVEVTSETVSILRKLQFDAPVARIVRDVANSQLFIAGDGTTASLILLGVLMDQADELIDQGLHPTTIVRGYTQAVDIARDQLLTMTETHDITDREICENVAQTVMTGTNLSPAKTTLAPLAVEAVTRVTDGYDVDLNAVRVRTDKGKGIGESKLVPGAIIDAVPNQTIKTNISGAKILFIDGSIQPKSTRTDIKITANSSADLANLRQTTADATDDIVEHLSQLAVDVVVADNASDDIRHALRDAGITLLTTLSDTDRRFLRRTFSAGSVSHPSAATENNIVAGDVRFHYDENYTTFTTDDAKTATLHLFSASAEQLEEIDNVFDKMIEAVTHVATDGRVLPGGTAPEAAMASAIRDQVPSVNGREQLAVYAFSDALETLPQLLATNAGLQGMDQVLALRTAHSNGEHSMGIDVDTSSLRDMGEMGILDTFVTKDEMLSNVRQAIRLIIRIDGIIEEPEAESQSRTGPTI